MLNTGATSVKVRKTEQRTEQNNDGVRNPQVGDFWHEMLAPIAVVVARPNDKTVLFCRKTMDADEGHWTWDLAKSESMTLDEFKTFLSYGSIPGCWADVVPKKMEWVRDEAIKLMFGATDG